MNDLPKSRPHPQSGAGTSAETIEKTASEDPLLEFIRTQWRPFLWGVIVVLAVIYAKRSFDETRVLSQQRAADVFLTLQTEYEIWRDSKRDNSEEPSEEAGAGIAVESQQRIEELLQALADERDPYPQFAELYRVLMEAESGAAASVGLSTDEASLIKELEQLVRARAMLWSGDPSQQAQGKEILWSLSEQKGYAAVSAALSLSRFLGRQQEGEEEKERLRKLLGELESAYPSQASLLEQEAAFL